MKNRKSLLLLFALPVLLLASCNNDEIEGGAPNVPGPNGDITFEIGFAPQGGAAYAAANGVPHTRVTTDNQFRSTWEDNDEIGVFAVIHGTSLSATATANYINNVKLTYNKTTGTWTPATPLYWQSNTNLDFYAYYPYNAGATDPTAIAFNVQTDQNGTTAGKSNYNLSDLLTAKSDNDGNGCTKSSAVSLQFSHALAMVQVNVPSGGKGFGPGPNLTVKLRGVKPGAAVNLGAASATPGSGVTIAPANNDATGITMYRVEQPGDNNYETSYTYRALVPAQEVAAGNNLLLFEHEERFLLQDGALAAKLALAAGTAEKFERSLPATLVHTVPIAASGKRFLMGSSNGSNYPGGTPGVDLNATPAEPDRSSSEYQHRVTLTKDFRMSTYEVTNAQYAAFLNAQGVTGELLSYPGYGSMTGAQGDVTYYKDNLIAPLKETQPYVYDGSATNAIWGIKWDADKWIPQAGYENHPVIWVTWFGAKAYADWVGGALPTEAQWEYACRGGTTTAFYFGDDAADFSTYGWCWENDVNDGYASGTKPVGLKQPNAYGLYDMHGNVREWCLDWYTGFYGYNSEADLLAAAITDPVVLVSSGSSFRILRGGSWYDEVRDCRSAFRYRDQPIESYRHSGFRVVFVP